MSSAVLTTTQLPRLRQLLVDWEKKQPPLKPFSTSLEDIKARSERTAVFGDALDDGSKDVIVAFRTRPPLENEAATQFVTANEDAGSDPRDVEFCPGITVASEEPGVFVAHTPSMKWNGPALAHKPFDADLAFGPHTSNEELYQRTVVANDPNLVYAQLVPLALGGGIGCVLSYGQTGSGKTYTMEGLEHRIARDLFDVADVVARRFVAAEAKKQSTSDEQPFAGQEEVHAADVFTFEVTFLELLGTSAVDLVDGTTGVDAQGSAIRKEIAIREDKAGNVVPHLISTPVHSSTELEDLITSSLSHRRTSATLRNARSSRSHALLTIRVKNKLLPWAEEGQLILVDLAGSERYEDSKAHDKQRMDESRENNKSLMNLKECVRAKARMAAEDGFVHIPWRMNKLTMLLKPIFDIESRQLSKAIVIAHVSPHIQDSVHSTSTLGYAAPFKTSPPKRRGPAPYDSVDPRTWNHEQTIAWFKREFAEKMVEQKGTGARGQEIVDIDVLCPGDMTARHFGKMTTPEFVARCLQAVKPTVRTVDSGQATDGDAVWTADALKELAATVVGSLFYLLLSAKTKKRNQVMRTRKGVGDVTEAYGAAPSDGYRPDPWTDEEEFETKIYFDKEWNTVSDAAMKPHRDNGDWEKAREALRTARLGLIQQWREARKEGRA
ncbi:P-loop containing nucleoside triphosphate hydrolase protein [Punctularia strigosozonata HHB-11173 SS5]|uniref:P-loop containing nucleoside triphosphate hydrolase protein n=1 Tax=Punctularia strigosozonata (strain HHB-11173) TaxID=741275 RepID=UPI0004417852|nr:P-loop containing nucleoside triphosphate hydrolase protein [Punctularia strigosozonata HHB-11173 SS5]EIN08038.1 P-loop containing nucleoside triphosphate hydrolase protein [Punctularia strigosozonata HHB-11173 SS5]